MKAWICIALKFLLLLFTGSIYIGQALAVPIPKSKNINLVLPLNAHARLQFGAEKLADVLTKKGYRISIRVQDDKPFLENSIIIGQLQSKLVQKAFGKSINDQKQQPGKEGFIIRTIKPGSIVIGGSDNSGVLYGCLELADRIKAAGKIPETLSVTDKPEMVLRGACIGVQKPYYLPGRTVYEYPYTPETFPWLYDKKLWIQYLDSMVENRMNSLYLWNGHPFASLVKLKEYPYAVEVDDATFKKNEEIYGFLTKEADKRGIWVIQMFYNIIVSKPFAEKHNIKTQDRERPIVPLISDYTRKSIAAFVEKYPNVGLMVCLGEAMEGAGSDDVEWFTKTIIPGVQDGLKALGKKEEPPIVLRAHDTDAPLVMKAALPLYKNLYTEAKFNGEALTTYEPRGAWAELHRTLSRIGTVQIENVHILANLEPFRYGSSDFIRKSVLGMHNIMEGNGLHLYPQASYWDWPYTADNVSPRLLQVERDWIWYKTWSRYAWNCHRDSASESKYWADLLAKKYGCSIQNGNDILKAYNESGEIAPKLLRRFGITDGNRQTLTLGMLMTQLINPTRFGLFTLLYDSESPEGEKLIEYAEKDWKGEKHIGETPVQIAKEVPVHGSAAVAAMEKAAPFVTRDIAEFNRLKNDMNCYSALAGCFSEKSAAALSILRYKYSNDVADLEKAVPHLELSLMFYKKLTDFTKDAYLYANSMQTQQRKIPMRGVDGTYKTWVEMLPVFEKELSTFKRKIDSIKLSQLATTNVAKKEREPLQNADLTLAGNDIGWRKMAEGIYPFADTLVSVLSFAKELEGLRSIVLPASKQKNQGTVIEFTNAKPVKVLVGFFNTKEAGFLRAPELETNASANDYGQAETKIANGLVVKGMPAVNIHTYSFKPGTNKLVLAKGMCLILGFIDEDQQLHAYDAGLYESGNKREIDWLFE
ncbi:MAG: hypothetical protein V4722_06460 [Bacteroidota bacterium]